MTRESWVQSHVDNKISMQKLEEMGRRQGERGEQGCGSTIATIKVTAETHIYWVGKQLWDDYIPNSGPDIGGVSH